MNVRASFSVLSFVGAMMSLNALTAPNYLGFPATPRDQSD